MNKFLVLIIVLSLFIRLWQIDSFAGLDFDQETAINISESILSGKFTLIGQEISIGGIYLAPYYNYFLSAILFVGNSNPSSIFIFHALSGAVSTYLIYYVANKIKSGSGILSALLYTFSYHLIYLDKTAAPSNLLVFFTLATLALHLSRLSIWKKFILTTLFVSFATATHFSAISLVAIPLIELKNIVSSSKSSKKLFAFISFLLIFSIGFFPLLVFDLRHGFIITSNLLSSSERLVNYPIYFRFFQRLHLFLDFIRKLFFPINLFESLQYLSLYIPVAYKIGNTKHTGKLLLVIISGFLIFTFYTGSVPEYYLLPSFIAAFLYISIKIHDLFTTSIFGKFFTSLFILFFIITNLYILSSQKNTFSLAHKKQIINYIKQNTDKPNPTIHIISDLGQNNGFKYLSKWQKLDAVFSHVNPDYIIFVPDKGAKSNYNAGSISVQKVVN